MKTKPSTLDNKNELNFSNSKIDFMSINIDEDIIDVYLLQNNIKVKSNNPEIPNYYRINIKDIGVKNDFQDINFTLVNDIKLTISIKFKNKFSSQGISFKDRLKFFNQPKPEQKKPNENQVVIKKIKMPEMLQKKEEEPKKREEPKKLEIPKSLLEPKKEEPKKMEEPKKLEIPKSLLEPKKEEPKKMEEPKKLEIPKSLLEPKKEEPKNIEEPKKLEIPKTFLESKKEEENKTEPPKKEEPKIEEESKKEEEPKKEEEVKNKEETKNEEENKKDEETKNEEESKNEEEIKNGEETKKEEEAKKEEETNNEGENKNEEEIKNEGEIKNEEETKKEEENKKEEEKKNEEGNKNEEENKKEIEKTNQEIQDNKEEKKVNENKENNNLNNDENEKTKETPNEEKITNNNNIPKKEETNLTGQKPVEVKETPKPEKLNPIKENEKQNFQKSKTLVETPFSKNKNIISKTKTQIITEEENEDDFVVLDIDDMNDSGRKSLTKSNQFFLEPKTYSQYLEDQKKKGIKHPYRETFCEGFFISSFPKKNGKVIENSESFMAQCGHTDCSKMPSMKPEIIFRYPLQDTKTLELNNLAATICFPTGIKVCYNENSDPAIIKDYVTSITNQKGERYYMMNYHFYLRVDSAEFQKYEENPHKYNTRKFLEGYLDLNLTEKDEEIIQNNLEFCSALASSDCISIPFCICLISKYPYVQEMKICLQSIYTIIKNENKVEPNTLINNLIMYLINSIPIPAKDTKVEFLIPYFNNYIDIDCPKLDDINIMNLSATSLLKYFSIDNLVIIFRLLITEKKILLFHTDYEILSTVADGLVSILYPFQWIHTYIPIMSDQMLKYLETFLPFLNGINVSLRHLVQKVFKEGEIDEDDEVFLVNIGENTNTIKLSSTMRGKNKKFEKYIQDNIPALPSALEKELKSKLKKAKYEVDDIEKNKKKKTTKNRRNVELQIRDAFIDIFVEMFQDYAKYLSFVDEDTVFNKSLFLESKSNNEKKFYNEILDTQLFQQFTQNVVNQDINYFNNKIALYEAGKKAKQKKKEEIKIEKEYCINPGFLNLTQDNEKINMKSLVKELKKKFPENNKKDSSDFILENSINIDNEKYDENNCQVYFTPEELETKKEPVPIVETIEPEKETKNPRKMTNNKILQRIKALNLKAAQITKKKEGLTEKEKDNIKEEIKDYLVKIFKSEEINLDEKIKKDLLNKITTPFGREFFISLLIRNSSNVILLKENSFSLLGFLIYNCLLNTLKLEETDKILEEIVQLLKCTQYFAVQEKDGSKVMFDAYNSKLKGTPKFTQDNFWQKWYESELKKNEKGKDDVKFKQNIIYDICKTLIRLELPKSLVKKLTNNININEFGKGSDLQKETLKVFIQFIINANYISDTL